MTTTFQASYHCICIFKNLFSNNVASMMAFYCHKTIPVIKVANLLVLFCLVVT